MAQHGGYGPPPGGYPPGGYPPGPPGPPGYAPPGAPPGGYAPPPHGAPPGGYGAPPPKKKDKTLLYVGLGCLALLVLGSLAAGVGWYVFTRSTAVRAIATGATAGGAECVKAIACCKAVVAKSSGDATALAACENLVNVPAAACAQALDTYKKSAAMLGVSCP